MIQRSTETVDRLSSRIRIQYAPVSTRPSRSDCVSGCQSHPLDSNSDKLTEGSVRHQIIDSLRLVPWVNVATSNVRGVAAVDPDGAAKASPPSQA